MIIEYLNDIVKLKYMTGVYIPYNVINANDYLLIQSIEEVAEIYDPLVTAVHSMMEICDLIGIHLLLLTVNNMKTGKYKPISTYERHYRKNEYIQVVCHFLRKRENVTFSYVMTLLNYLIGQEVNYHASENYIPFYNLMYDLMASTYIKMAYRLKLHNFSLYQYFNVMKAEKYMYNYLMKRKTNEVLKVYITKMYKQGVKTW